MFLELFRPSDGARSEAKDFSYVPLYDKRGGNRACLSSNHSSFELPLTLNSYNEGNLNMDYQVNSEELERALHDKNYDSEEFKKIWRQFGEEYINVSEEIGNDAPNAKVLYAENQARILSKRSQHNKARFVISQLQGCFKLNLNCASNEQLYFF